MAKEKKFLSDIQTIRKRAREHIQEGAVTSGYTADRKTSGINAQSVAAEFLEHANEEQGHADLICTRIVQLGGAPNLSPEGMLTRSHSEYVEGENLVDMIQENLVAERIAIDTYREIIQYLGNDDPTTRRMMEGILASEEEHAEDLSSLLEELGKKGEPAKQPVAKAKKR